MPDPWHHRYESQCAQTWIRAPVHNEDSRFQEQPGLNGVVSKSLASGLGVGVAAKFTAVFVGARGFFGRCPSKGMHKGLFQ